MEDKDNKSDYQAILEPGIHQCSLAELKELTVDRFPSSSSRPRLYQGLSTVIERILPLVPTFVMYVDGSFLTEKINPDDLDCVALIRKFFINALSERDIQALGHMVNRDVLRERFGLDFYCDPDVQTRHDYWDSVFGVMRDQTTKKGYVRLELSK